jgi:hypothetical protein
MTITAILQCRIAMGPHNKIEKMRRIKKPRQDEVREITRPDLSCAGSKDSIVPAANPLTARLDPLVAQVRSPNTGECHMSITKRTLLASGVTLLSSLSLVSLMRAQGQPQGSNQAQDLLLDHEAIRLTPEGRHAQLRLSETGIDAVKKYGRETNGHALLAREGGRNYVVEDRKMPDGSMLFDRRRDWTASASTCPIDEGPAGCGG